VFGPESLVFGPQSLVFGPESLVFGLVVEFGEFVAAFALDVIVVNLLASFLSFNYLGSFF
ncbi:MAG: hypothetical protein AAGB24_13930, partial [Bacteroidota bacterium]